MVPRPRGRVALALLAVLTVAGCNLTTEQPSGRPRPSLAERSAAPTAPPSVGPFRPMAYPVAGDAPCAQPTAPDARHAPYRGELKRIRAVDADTVAFDLCFADVAFRSKVASPTLPINDTAWLESKLGASGDHPAILTEANGTGPFRLGAWRSGSDIELDRNEAYWDGAPDPAAVIVRWSDDPGERLAQLQGSTVDGIDAVDPEDLESVASDPDLASLPRAGMNIAYLGMNRSFAPFDKEGVRRAIAMGIDRSALVQAAFPKGSQVATHFTPCPITDGCAGADWYEYDALAADDLLATAGFPDGFSTTLTYSDTPRDYLPDPTAVAQMLADRLKADLGIDVTLKVQDLESLTADADAGRIEGLYLLGARPRYPDASYLLDGHFGSQASAQFGPQFEDVVTALDDASGTTDAAKRTKAYGEANDAIRKHAPMVPLAHVGSSVAVRADVDGAVFSPLGIDSFATVVPGDRSQYAFMQAEEPGSLYCADETDVDAQRVCAQINESLYRFGKDDASVEPALATGCKADAALTTWTCTLRPGVRFHDGAALDANDVVLSYAAIWDAEHPLHRGRTGDFSGFTDRFGGLLDPPS